jgi:anti-sigma B factor antagonist
VTLTHSVTHSGRCTTIALVGEADLCSSDELHDALFGAIGNRPAKIIVDLAGLVFIDSMSIGTLVAARRAALEHGSSLVAINPRGQARRVFEITGLRDILSDDDRPDCVVDAG